ncbi:MAG: DNA polymerase III subunit delta' [Armatimonadetes bacterium]|nr:DNA polymerase III subunit delta' [Armatimonadota bacterium]
MPFRDIVGQHHAIVLLREAVRAGRMAHAYLFVGPAGVGRRSLALAFAQFLNCERPDGDGCGVCRACRRIAEGNHPDVHLLDIEARRFLIEPPKDYKAREIPIEQIRALRQDASYPPYEGRAKVYIVADAERLSPGAANSLLKVLEEPPPAVSIILIAESTTPLPATLLSRCQVVRCSSIPSREIERTLTEQHGVTAGRARILAALSAGRMARALALAQSGDLLEARERFLSLLADLERAGPVARLDAAEQLTRERERLPERLADLLEIAAWWYRDLAVWKETQDPALLINLDKAEEVARLSAALSWEDLRRRIEAVDYARDSLDRNVQPRLLLESLFFKIAPAAAPA